MAVLADLPGPKIRVGSVPARGGPVARRCPHPAGARRGPEHRGGDLRRLPDACSTTCARGTGSCSATAPSASTWPTSPRAPSTASCSRAAGCRAGPACTSRPSGLRLTAPTSHDLELAKRVRRGGRRLHRGVVRPQRRRRAHGPPGDRAARPGARGQDRDRAGDREPGRHPRGGRRRDGRSRRPRHRVPARGRAAPAEADHPVLRGGRCPRDHRHPDAREHDLLAVADAGRGVRRRQRGVRRHRRRDAVRRDGDRQRPRPRRAHHGPHRRAGRVRGELRAVGQPAGAGAAARPHRRPRPDDPGASPTPRSRPPTTSGWPRSCAARAAAAPPGRWPATARRLGSSGSAPTPRRPGSWRCRGGSSHWWSTSTTRPTTSCGSRSKRAVHAGLIRTGDQVLVLAGAPDRPSGAATDVLRAVTVE